MKIKFKSLLTCFLLIASLIVSQQAEAAGTQTYSYSGGYAFYLTPGTNGLQTFNSYLNNTSDRVKFSYNGTIYYAPSDKPYSLNPNIGLVPGTSYSNIFYLYETEAPYGASWTTLIAYNQWLTFVTAPNPVNSVFISGVTANQFTASWNTNGNGSATSYQIYTSPNAGGPWTQSATSGSGSATVGGLSAGTTYYYFIRAVTTAGDTADTAVASVTTHPDATANTWNNTLNDSVANISGSTLGNTNTIINSFLSTNAGIIQDNSGNTVLSVAKAASQNALNANTTLSTSAGVVQDSSGTVLQSARQAVTSINNAQTTLSNQMSSLQSNLNNSITNIQNFMAPPLNKISGYLNTTVTSGSSINLTLDYSQANEYQYRIDNGSWSSWTSLASHDANGYLTVPGLTSGFHTIYIQIRYNNGTVVSPAAKGSITVQKL